MPTNLALTRGARWVCDFANVPRFGLRPNLLLDFATSNTQRTLLVAVGVISTTKVTIGHNAYFEALSRLTPATKRDSVSESTPRGMVMSIN